MIFFKHIAQSIVEEISPIFDFPVMITDDAGVIIGCTDSKRLGSHHIATSDVTKSGEITTFSKEQTAGLENVLPGVAAPLTFHQHTIGIIGLIGDVAQVGRYAPFVQTHIELLLMEKFRTKTVVAQMEVLRDFGHLLLSYKKEEDCKQILHYSEMLGFQTDLHRRCILIDIPLVMEAGSQTDEIPSFNTIEQELFLLLGNLFGHSDREFLAPLNASRWIILKHVDGEDSSVLKKKLEEAYHSIQKFLQKRNLTDHVTLAYGDYHSRPEGIVHSYDQARKALNIAKRNQFEEPIVSLDDWNLLSLALVEEMALPARQTLDTYVEQINAHANGKALIESFLIYCEEQLNMSQAARRLFIHRNTLLYRLQQLQQLLNIDLESFDQCMLLYLTLKKHMHEEKMEKATLSLTKIKVDIT